MSKFKKVCSQIINDLLHNYNTQILHKTFQTTQTNGLDRYIKNQQTISYTKNSSKENEIAVEKTSDAFRINVLENGKFVFSRDLDAIEILVNCWTEQRYDGSDLWVFRSSILSFYRF